MNDFLEFLMNDFQSEKPMLAVSMTQKEFAELLFASYIDTFVDYSTGDAYFDSDEFVKLLEIVNKFTPDEKWYYASLARKLKECTFTNLQHFGDLGAYASALHGDFNITGFPGDSTGVVLMPVHMFGISAASQNIEGAWAFLRELYEDENAHNVRFTSIPINKTSYNALKNEYIYNSFTFPLGESAVLDGDSVFVIKDVTLDHIDTIIEQIEMSIEQIERIYTLDDNLMNIIHEELLALFHDNRSAKDTARVIQSRAQRYLWELN
jgi:ABC-type glycerol-3-phosphate transport system substrate-binding protein